MKTSIFLAAVTLCSLSSCNKKGCTDPDAYNYNETATKNDGSCEYILGCTDPTSTNYNSAASKDDGTCSYEGSVLFWTDQPGISFTITYDGVESDRSILTHDEAPNDCSDPRDLILSLPEGEVTIHVKVYNSLGMWAYTFKYDVLANECQAIFID